MLSLVYAGIFSGATTFAGIGLNLIFFKKSKPAVSTVVLFILVAFLIVFAACAHIMPSFMGNLGFFITALLSMFTFYKTINI